MKLLMEMFLQEETNDENEKEDDGNESSNEFTCGLNEKRGI